MKVLICGLLETDSGKTTVAMGLIRNLIELGYDIGVFKPISFHNWFYQHDTSKENIKKGSLFSEDIRKLAKVAELDLPYELLNPVDGITFPPNPLFFIEKRMLARYYSLFHNTLSIVGLMRFSIRGSISLDIYALNDDLIEREYFYYDEDFINKILAKAQVILKVHGPDQIVNLMRYYAPHAIRTCYQYLRRMFRNLVIESLNNVAAPSLDVLDVDLVLVTAPGTVMVYEGPRYRKAVLLYASFHRTLDIRTSDIITLITPLKYFKISPLTKSELEDYERLAKKFMELSAFIEKYVEE